VKPKFAVGLANLKAIPMHISGVEATADRHPVFTRIRWGCNYLRLQPSLVTTWRAKAAAPQHGVR